MDDQIKVNFLINLFLYISNQNEEIKSERNELISFRPMISNEESKESDILKAYLNQIFQSHRLPDAELFYDEMLDKQFKNDITELMWSPSRINQNYSQSLMKINYDQVIEESCNLIHNNDSSSHLIINNCYEAKMSLCINLFKSKTNDIQICEKTHILTKGFNHSINYPKMSVNISQIINKHQYKTRRNKVINSNFLIDEVSKAVSLYSNQTIRKKKSSSRHYFILNQSYSQNTTKLTNKYDNKDTITKLFECPINSYITLDYNETHLISQIILKSLRNEQCVLQLLIQEKESNKKLKKMNKEERELELNNVNDNNYVLEFSNAMSVNIDNLNKQMNKISIDDEDIFDKETYEEVCLEINNKYHQLSFI